MTAHEQFAGSARFWLPGVRGPPIRRGGWGVPASGIDRLLERRDGGGHVLDNAARSRSSGLMDFRTGAARIGLAPWTARGLHDARQTCSCCRSQSGTIHGAHRG
jgi:hypothetical protein